MGSSVGYKRGQQRGLQAWAASVGCSQLMALPALCLLFRSAAHAFVLGVVAALAFFDPSFHSWGMGGRRFLFRPPIAPIGPLVLRNPLHPRACFPLAIPMNAC